MTSLSRLAILSFLAMSQYAFAAGNSVYVDQIGTGSTISLTQTGASNEIGNSTKPATITHGSAIVCHPLLFLWDVWASTAILFQSKSTWLLALGPVSVMGSNKKLLVERRLVV